MVTRYPWSCTSVVDSDVVELRLIFHSTEHFSVTFRTSRAKNDNGFELSVICFDPINTNKAGVYVVCVCVCVHVGTLHMRVHNNVFIPRSYCMCVLRPLLTLHKAFRRPPFKPY